MQQEWEHDTTLTREIARLHEIPLTAAEREAAIEHLRRGERFADILLTTLDAARFFSSTLMSTLRVATRHAAARYRSYRHNRYHRHNRVSVARR